jgi:uncharacterized repeat protein (TIGR03803 family)
MANAWAAVQWNEKVLHAFNDHRTDGSSPEYGLVIDAAGNLYGTTPSGGIHDYGTVFELSPTVGGGWTETVLHNFNQNGTDGALPSAALIFDAAGNLYGTTSAGGLYYDGTVFELSPTVGGGWTETVLHNFNQNGTDGVSPSGGLIFDAAGNLYGTTFAGGLYLDGTVFELSPAGGGAWTETVLYTFCSQNDCRDGSFPAAGLIFDAAGNLYGTTQGSGSMSNLYYGETVFELRPVHACTRCSHAGLL